MAKTNGPWSPLYGQAWDHEKTARAVAHATAADRRIPRDCASSVVLGWLNRLNLWCLSCAEDGTVSALSDAKLGMVAWPEGAESRPAAKVGALVRASLRAGGFIEGEGSAERIHEFRHHHRGILRKREDSRDRREAQEGEHERDDARTHAWHHAEGNARDHATTPSGSGRVGSGRDGAIQDTPTGAEPPAGPPSDPLVGAIRSAPIQAWQADPRVTPAWAATQRAAFPGLDLVAEARKAAAWWSSNPARTRGRSAVARFLATWFGRAAEGLGTGRPEASRDTPGPRAPEPDPAAQARRRAEAERAEADRAAFLASGCATRSEWVRLKSTGAAVSGPGHIEGRPRPFEAKGGTENRRESGTACEPTSPIAVVVS